MKELGACEDKVTLLSHTQGLLAKVSHKPRLPDFYSKALSIFRQGLLCLRQSSHYLLQTDMGIVLAQRQGSRWRQEKNALPSHLETEYKWKEKQNLATLVSKYLHEKLSVTCDMFNTHMDSHLQQYSILKYEGFVSPTK